MKRAHQISSRQFSSFRAHRSIFLELQHLWVDQKNLSIAANTDLRITTVNQANPLERALNTLKLAIGIHRDVDRERNRLRLRSEVNPRNEFEHDSLPAFVI